MDCDDAIRSSDKFLNYVCKKKTTEKGNTDNPGTSGFYSVGIAECIY